MATIDKLNFPQHSDYQVDHSIPDNQKFSAWELNAMTGKTDEIIEKISGLIKGIKVRMIELPQSEKLEDYTNGYVNSTPKYFEIGRDEIVVIKHYIHSPSDNNVILGWNVSIFSKGEGKWGHPGSDSTITPVNIGDYIFLSTSIINETQTTIQQPELNGNILTIKYTGESGVQQLQTVDLSDLVTNDIYIDDADYDAAQNIITITRNDGQQFQINLSEFSIVVSTDANGVVTVVQEGVTKFTISKVGTTGDYNDLINKPSLAPTDKLNDVVIRGSYSSKPISFLSSSTTPDTGSAIGAIGVHVPTYSYHFGDFSQIATGLYNVAMSYGSLQKLTTGEYNIAIGVFTGKETTTGKSNVFIGGLTGQKNTTGNFNAFFGRQAGNENVIGYKNVYFGTYAGYNSNSNLNTIIGYKAGNTTAMGDRNLFLGSFSGQGMTGVNNIVFGIGAGYNDGAINNKLIIHNNNTLGGYGPDDTQEGTLGSPQQGQLSRALVTGDFLDRWFKINGYIVAGTPGISTNDITILPGTGIYSTLLHNPVNDFYFVQKGWVAANYYLKTEVDSLISRTYRVMGSKANFAALPATGNKVGDVWNLLDTGDNYVYVDDLNNTGSPGWDKLAGMNDLSSYATITYVDNKFIPYTGTGSKTISGYLDFDNNTGIRRIDTNFEGESEIKFYQGIVEMSCRDTSPSGFKTLLQIEPTQINISSTSTSSRGITAAAYYGANIQDNDYVQKKFVDDGFVPLTGTFSNKPLTGDIQIRSVDDGAVNRFYRLNTASAVYESIIFDPQSLQLKTESDDSGTDNYASLIDIQKTMLIVNSNSGNISLDTDKILINSNTTSGSKGIEISHNANQPILVTHTSDNVSPRGLSSNQYFGAAAQDNDFVQKKFVVEAIAMGNFIPLDGTVLDKAVTGNIEFSNETPEEKTLYRVNDIDDVKNTISLFPEAIMISSGNIDLSNFSSIDVSKEEGVIAQGLNSELKLTGSGASLRNLSDSETKGILVSSNPDEPILIEQTATGGRGLSSGLYFGLQAQDNDYVQKKFVVDEIIKNLKPYKSYVCLMQAGGTPTPSPSFVELENSIGAIIWTRSNVGEYIGTLVGAFPMDKVVCFAQSAQGNGGIGPNKNIITARLTNDSVFVKVTNNDENATPFETSGQFGSLEIRVYP